VIDDHPRYTRLTDAGWLWVDTAAVDAGFVDDADSDGGDDAEDACLTAASDEAPSLRLGRGRWADTDGDRVFETLGFNPLGRAFDVESTAGCDCWQIIDACGYGVGQLRFGCTGAAMDWWTGRYTREGRPSQRCAWSGPGG